MSKRSVNSVRSERSLGRQQKQPEAKSPQFHSFVRVCTKQNRNGKPGGGKSEARSISALVSMLTLMDVQPKEKRTFATAERSGSGVAGAAKSRCKN